MQQIQIFLPLYNENGEAFSKHYYSSLKEDLTDKFGGITIYTRSPAIGFWKENETKIVKDEIIIYEIMAESVDKDWWQRCRNGLEKLFRQDQIIIRTWKMELL
ncbi:MAG: hypothetical protein H7Y07_06245 [Pyrinomonadaceae bacterium]|nr:hypothetical protein [Sphingobacteriaceae bacterium]